LAFDALDFDLTPGSVNRDGARNFLVSNPEFAPGLKHDLDTTIGAILNPSDAKHAKNMVERVERDDLLDPSEIETLNRTLMTRVAEGNRSGTILFYAVGRLQGISPTHGAGSTKNHTCSLDWAG
jgi:hypothetical protein